MTNDQLHKELLGLHKTLINIQAQLVKMEQINLQAVKAVDDHEMRIRKLEEVANHAKGAIAVYIAAGTILASVASVIANLVMGS